MKALLACVTLAVATLSAQEVPLEYQVKAAYLFNFTKFVGWPPAVTSAEGPFAICVARLNPFGTVLSGTVTGETAAGRPLVSRVVHEAEPSCQILFVPRGVAAGPYLRAVRSEPVLTVGESADFLEQGGIVRFVVEEGKVRFEINQGAAGRAGITVSSRLLKLARNAGTAYQ
jgi:hypothetical protein